MRNRGDDRLVFLYPGQGAQHVGMGLDLYQASSRAREIFDQADAQLGFSLRRLCFDGPVEQLNSDLNAQLAVYTVSCIITDILRSENIFAREVTGYSAGFYGAAYAAGCFDFRDGLEIVRRAGEILLDEGSKIDGGMAVIFGLSLQEVDRICAETGEVCIAIVNTRRQIVISGLKPAVFRAMELAKAAGALDTYLLPVATAYHSGFLGQSGERLFKDTEDLSILDPAAALFSYSSLDRIQTGRELQETMGTQLSRPVLWVDLVMKLRDNGRALWIEIGPGAVLSRTVRWIDRHIEIMNTAREDKVRAVIERIRKQP